MKTPYLDNLIKGLEDGQSKGINSYYLNCQLRELKDIKQQLTLTDVMPTLVLFADWLQYNGKWSTTEQQVKDFLKEQQKQN